MRLQKRAETALGMLSPLLLWSIYFLVVYLLVAIACARLSETDWVRPTLWVVSTIATVGVLGTSYLFWSGLRQGPTSPTKSDIERRTRLRVGLFISILSLVAVIWTALPTLFLQPCE
ncbi:hypothetical protein [Thiohalomonas denitrificans]|uniref:Transmembrane protein n=1 Tax=Thiohalomonas denitrificans TaxID=415747 RepID=A0A1G5QEN0_9GAMM|nr:hypothetical protein [Thiohalomonas denitrificans]SCZ60345.1 hypothetical protein SAMN03097708_02036 [Thiohalomonas denitrificans]